MPGLAVIAEFLELHRGHLAQLVKNIAGDVMDACHGLLLSSFPLPESLAPYPDALPP
jgi:hypothetical protein